MSIMENALAEIERQRLKHEPYSPVNMVGMQLVEVLKALPERASEVVLADLCAEGMKLEAVSYTHLDVYKRQHARVWAGRKGF